MQLLTAVGTVRCPSKEGGRARSSGPQPRAAARYPGLETLTDNHRPMARSPMTFNEEQPEVNPAHLTQTPITMESGSRRV